MPDEMIKHQNPFDRLSTITRNGVKWAALADIAPGVGFADTSGLLKMIERNPDDFLEGVEVLNLRGSEAHEAAVELAAARGEGQVSVSSVRMMTFLSLAGLEAVAYLAQTAPAREMKRALIAARRTPTPRPEVPAEPLPRLLTYDHRQSLDEITNLRKRLAEKEPKRITPDVRAKVLPHLGKATDDAIAGELGIAVEAVAKVRRAEGFAPFRLDPRDDPQVHLAVCGAIQIGAQRTVEEIARWVRITPGTTRDILYMLEREGHVTRMPLDRWTAKLNLVPWEQPR